MGCGQSEIRENKYSVAISQAKQGETEVYRNYKCKDTLITQPDPETITIQDAFLRSVRRFPNKDCLGKYGKEDYEFLTYSQVNDQSSQLGSGLQHLKLVKKINEFQDFHLQLIGIFAKNRVEWMLVDIANILYGFTLVPFYDTLGAESIPFILGQTNLETMFLSVDALKTILQVKERYQLKNLIFFDPISEEQRAELIKLGYNIYQFQDIIELGKKNILPFAKYGPHHICTFSYTSGTTGNPKGAMITHQNLISAVAAASYTETNFNENDVHISYLPLPHIMEKLAIVSMLYFGATIGFYRGDPNLLKEDIAKLRPTYFLSVPRLYNKFYDGIKAKIEQVTGVKKMFADRAIQVKLENLRKDGKVTDSLYDKAFQGVRDLFGGRCRLLITGSAPIQQEIKDFMKIAACVPMLEGYGQTEGTGAEFVSATWDTVPGCVGGVTTNTEFKLVDVPEMNYHSIDVIDGKPYPRGEICVRGPGIFAGYYKDIEKTNEAVDQEGWLHSGDVGMILPNGGLKIIDRKKNIFKLSQGEYIAPEKIESIYNRATGVAESFVYGDSLQYYCVGIIIPHQEWVTKFASQNNIQGTFEELCKNPNIISALLENLLSAGRQNKLNSLEQVKKIYVEPRSLQTYDCFTTTFKLKRHEAKKVFQKQIDEMYKQ